MRTMGRILENWRTICASLFAVMLVVGAYVFARGIESPPTAQASTESELLKAIATKDSNGDGLPDWQKALYGIPLNSGTTDYFHLGMTDGEAVAKGLIVPKAVADIPVATSPSVTVDTDGLPPAPAEGTLTAAFSQSFFTLYLQAKQNAGGADLTDLQLKDIANQALSLLSSSVASVADYKKPADLAQSLSGADALTTFAVTAEALLRKNSNNATTTELVYLKYAENGDTVALTKIGAMAKSYRDSAVGLAMLAVPPELASADLELVNALMRMSKILNDFTLLNTDPLAAMLALTQYSTSIQGIAKAFTDIGIVYSVSGVHLPLGAPGASFVNLMSDVSTRRGTP